MAKPPIIMVSLYAYNFIIILLRIRDFITVLYVRICALLSNWSCVSTVQCQRNTNQSLFFSCAIYPKDRLALPIMLCTLYANLYISPKLPFICFIAMCAGCTNIYRMVLRGTILYDFVFSGLCRGQPIQQPIKMT